MVTKRQYYQRLYQIYRNYKKRKVTTTALPIRLWVELDSRCNLKCVMCPNKDLPVSQQGSMSWEIFKSTVDQAKDFIYEMALHHRGESLLHPEAMRFIHYAAEKIPITKLHTNGTLLNSDQIQMLIQSGMTRVSFSFDGFTKSDYEKIRVGANYDQVVENIKNLLISRNQAGRKFPEVAIEVIELSKSQLQKEKQAKFIKEFKQLGLDELIIKKPHNWAGLIKVNYAKKKYAPCTFLWNALLILWNGDVVPCAQDFMATYVVGNIKEKSIREIWNDQPLQTLRQGLINGQQNQFPACSECDRLWRNTFLGIPKEYLKQILLNKMP